MGGIVRAVEDRPQLLVDVPAGKEPLDVPVVRERGPGLDEDRDEQGRHEHQHPHRHRAERELGAVLR